MRFLLAVLISASFFVDAQEGDASDILFLKIQELEVELAALRSELESQSYLIDKLLNEGSVQSETLSSSESNVMAEESTFRFQGINESQSIEEVYKEAKKALFDNNDSQAAKKSFIYLVNNFNDDEKIPLSLFWLGEISLQESSLIESNDFFQTLTVVYPDHFRTPLAHKKIGDIFMMSDETSAAKIKYQFVVQTFPDSNASSLALQALQLLANME
jgi:TolA-binding protein